MKNTHQNLLKAITGEALARNKYTFFAKIAQKEGLVWISQIFLETADNERAHAEEMLELLQEPVEMTNTYDIHPLKNTLENLRIAALGETDEYEKMYPEFENIAREEKELEAAHLFQEISEVEEKHAERYTLLADRLEKGILYKTDEEIEWKCLNCGYIHKGTSAPATCPLCKKPQGWYMALKMVR
ncbi:MAG: ferritin family protein [Candidatus Paceibacterota bacterium]|jgi:rubrerythrin|nr:ferritin family protein [Candidatus Paceibacterota bacterium]